MKSSIIFILIAILCLGMIGCRSQRHTSVETVKHDSTSINTEKQMHRVRNLENEIRVKEQRDDRVSLHDSVILRDSIVVHINNKGEMVSKERYRDQIHKSDRTSSKEENKQTEIISQHFDSILTAQKTELMAIVEEYQKESLPVERKLTKWEKFKREIGNISIGVYAVVLAVTVIWLIKKARIK